MYAGATYATYKFFTKSNGPGNQSEAAGGDLGDNFAFDRLAAIYDSTVGSEEKYMMYGLMR